MKFTLDGLEKTALEKDDRGHSQAKTIEIERNSDYLILRVDYIEAHLNLKEVTSLIAALDWLK